MKIGLNIQGMDGESDKAAEQRALDIILRNVQKGDWEAKDLLLKQFRTLVTSLAEKRTTDPAVLNKYTERGNEGLLKAARKFKPEPGADNFRIFALDHIESAMNQQDKGGGFLGRLFGKG
ncbi:MAG: hypothetical protein E4H02_01530 [Lentisphaerales bacterium]|jgi:DNA-directed RNA polymerase specialized sigma subunit|nr:MAG: hypothetical protein E4H02_01530 [Lentisphaerales bacterium]